MKLASFTGWRSGAGQAVRRFPWNMLSAAVGVTASIVAIHCEKNDRVEAQAIRTAMTAALGMPLLFSFRMMRERIPRISRFPMEVIGVLLLALWWCTEPAQLNDAPSIVVFRWFLLLAALHFFAAVSAYLGGRESIGFWQFNRRLFARFCLATLYTGVLVAGLELALLSADKLFSLNLGKAYADLWLVMTGLFHPVFFLAGVPRDFAALETEEEYPRGLKGFTQFALAPLVAVYTAILYTYAAKILIARAWPHGWVALPVILLSGIGVLSFLLLYPLRNRPSEKWAHWFNTNFPRALAPLSLLLLLSVRVRIRAYGVTEERYVGVVIGLWILAWAVVFITRRNTGIRWVPTSLSIICLLTAFGPWSAGAISRASQLRRLEHMLQTHGLWKDGHAAKADRGIDLSAQESDDFRSTLTYLVRAHGGMAVQKIFEGVVSRRDWSTARGWDVAHDVTEALQITTRDIPEYGATVSRKPGTALQVGGYTKLWRVQVYSGSSSPWQPSHQDDVDIGIENGVLKLQVPGAQREAVPLESIEGRVKSETAGQLPADQLTVDFQQGGRQFRIIFESLTLRRESGGPAVSTCDFYLLEK